MQQLPKQNISSTSRIDYLDALSDWVFLLTPLVLLSNLLICLFRRFLVTELVIAEGCGDICSMFSPLFIAGCCWLISEKWQPCAISSSASYLVSPLRRSSFILRDCGAIAALPTRTAFRSVRAVSACCLFRFNGCCRCLVLLIRLSVSLKRYPESKFELMSVESTITHS